MRYLLCTLLVMLLGILSASNIYAQTSADDTMGEDVHEAIQATFQKMVQAMADGDAARVAFYFTEDAFLKFPGQEPLQGRQAIERAHEPIIEQNMSIRPTTQEVQPFGDMAYELGSFEIVTAEGDVVDQGHYLSVWKLVDGQWRLHRDIISNTEGGDGQ